MATFGQSKMVVCPRHYVLGIGVQADALERGIEMRPAILRSTVAAGNCDFAILDACKNHKAALAEAV